MSQKKKQLREDFRRRTFERDQFRCVCCGLQATPATAETLLDAHHISNRKTMPNGGYVKENGITLCKGTDGFSCHEKAELWLSGAGEPEGFAPAELYANIDSSHEEAVAASERLRHPLG